MPSIAGIKSGFKRVKLIPEWLEPKVSSAEKRFEQLDMLKVFGQRMKEARQLNNWTQQEAALKLGYENSSKLAKIENASDTDSIPWSLPYTAAVVYDVSIDFLFGIVDDWERDPVVYQQRLLNKCFQKQMERHFAAQQNAIRIMSNKMTVVEKAVSMFLNRSVEMKETVCRFRELNPTEFDDEKRLSAKLMRMAIETVEEAMGISSELQRVRAYAITAAKSDENLDIFVDQPELDS